MKPDGGPAFPYSALTPNGPQIYGDSTGMSLRDWFAGQALSGDLPSYGWRETGQQVTAEAVANDAYKIADAMLVEREKEKP